ncbi:cell adhesion molecule CEACAM1-like [Ctenodactylus gundi]
MEPISTFPRRGHVSWQEIMLTVSLLTTWNLPVAAQLSIESVPFNATENGDILLLAYNLPQEFLGFQWYRGKEIVETQRIGTYIFLNSYGNIPGPANSGRETIYPNGTLQIQNVTQEDEGSYTLQIIHLTLQVEQASGQFHQQLHSHGAQGHYNTNLWPRNSGNNHQRMINVVSLPNDHRLELSKDSRTLIVFNVTRNDTGPYVCITLNLVSANQRDTFTLNISCDYFPFLHSPDCQPKHTRPEARPLSPSWVQVDVDPHLWTPGLAMTLVMAREAQA